MNERRAVFAAFADSRTGNRGAVSMLESAIDHLTTPPRNAVMNVFTVYPRDDRKLPPTPRVNLFNGSPWSLAFKLIPLAMLYRLCQALRLPLPRWFWGRDFGGLLDADVCLMIGGTTFTDAQILKVVFNVACLLPAILLGKKSMMVSQTLGPFRKWPNRLLARRYLSRMDVVVPRGEGSLEHVRRLNLPGSVEYIPDAAFSLVVDADTDRRIRETYAHLPRGKGIVGLCINSIVERKCRSLGIDHHGAWVELIRHLADQGYTVLLIPHSMRQKSPLRHNNDLLSLRRIVKMLPTMERTYVIDNPYNCKELRAVVGLCDFCVVSRFHAMISALCGEVPVLVYGWGFQKYREVMAEFRLEDYCHDAADLSGENLVEGFERIVRDADSIRQRIAANLPRMKQWSCRNHDRAWELFEIPNPRNSRRPPHAASWAGGVSIAVQPPAGATSRLTDAPSPSDKSPLAPPETPLDQSPSPSQARRGRKWIAWLIELAVLAVVGRALVVQLRAVSWADVAFSPVFLLLAVAASVASRLMTVSNYRDLLAGFGQKVPFAGLAAASWVSQLGKYIPGKVASVAGTAWALRAFGVPVSVATAVMFLLMGLLTSAGIVLSLPLTLWQPVLHRLPLGWLWCLALLAAGAVCLHPRVFGSIVTAALRLLKRPAVPVPKDAAHYFRPLVSMFGQWVLQGTAVWAVARSVTEVSPSALPFYVSAQAMSATLGILVFFAPAGLGVRDGVLLLLLNPTVGPSKSAVVVVAVRLMATLLDAVMAGVGLTLLRRYVAAREAKQ